MIFLETVQKIIMHVHPIWENVFFYLLIAAILGFGFLTYVMMKAFKKRTVESKLMQQQHVAKVDIIRKDHTNTLEDIRIEMLKREEERSRQWMESEKETLHVLNGVSNLLDLSEKIGRVESEKILKKLEEIQEKVENKSESNDKNGSTEGS